MGAETKTIVAPRSLTTLLAGAIDYAGLFPPAELTMQDAVRNYADYSNSADAWALGRFIVPVSRLMEFQKEAEPYFSESVVWKLSALARTNINEELKQSADFNSLHANNAVVDTIEAKALTAGEVQNITSATPKSFHVFIEIPIATDPTELIRSIGRAGAYAKVRTGGVAANAFPSATDLERFIRVCIAENVMFKATAGLHHPMRSNYSLTYKPGSETAKMYGYLNVFLVAAFVNNGMRTEDALKLLEEESPDAFRFSDEGVEWRNFHLDEGQLRNTRQNIVLSFGSCSFREPLDDLKKMKML